MKRLTFILILLIGFLQTGFGQDQLSSSIYIFEYEDINDTLEISNALFLSGFNKDGYNAQLAPLNKRQLILVSNQNTKSPKTSEIISLDIAQKAYHRITTNNRLETFPQWLENGDISVVEYSNNGDSFLNILNAENSNNKTQVFEHLDNIESATWLDSETVILNLKSDLNYMAVGYKSDDSFKIMEANVAHRIVPIDASNFYYIHKLRADKWYLKKYDIDFLKKKTITEMPKMVDDFDVMGDGSFICGRGSKIYMFQPGHGNEWAELFDLAEFNITQILEVRSTGNAILVVAKN